MFIHDIHVLNVTPSNNVSIFHQRPLYTREVFVTGDVQGDNSQSAKKKAAKKKASTALFQKVI
jgi:hypothetical protein